MKEIESEIKTSLQACRRLLDFLEEGAWMTLVEISQALMDCFEKGGSVFACGNGGSATQAAHFAAELVGRYNKMDKRSLPAFALGENSAIVTALSNDYTFSDVFARQLEGLGKQGDCLIALSTSGNSENVLRACRVAKKKGMRVFAFTGRGGGQVAQLCEALLMFPENDTPRIQEAHLIALHTICQLIERKLLSQERQTSAAAARGERS